MTEPEPERFTPLRFQDGIRRIVAPNPGSMTYHGTNTWLIDWEGGTVVLDPGSEDQTHLDAIVREAGPRLSHILVSHWHSDHLSGAVTLHRRTGAPIASFHRFGGDPSHDPDFAPTIPLHDGDRIAGLEALHTPGHASDHLCFAAPGGLLFSGDHVMGWSTSVVPPHPYGDLGEFVRQLERVRDRDDRVILSAHGPAITEPRALVQSLLDHRHAREASIAVLLTREPQSFDAVFERAYPNVKTELRLPARANLLAHLQKLEKDGRARQQGETWFLVAGVEKDPPSNVG
ncbi:MBL fold metallo-hydrolase [Acetobacteraceae bacterium KSS8]|uniref:MBL fold metallo-hydrolase n=1 Tax=Endosaccharibacter trunci TaxID=2812733 RepID=A0ABT1W475_9PROT|nr:MBL fold metallo-hydrolase [Acetobacteraceae bacterium KSS8]